MHTLLERADQALPITKMARSSKEIIDHFVKGDKEKYVVMRNNIPAAVLMSVPFYEHLMDLIEEFQVEALAVKRSKSLSKSKLISHADMIKKFQSEQ
jgi:antitoxin StbD